MTHTPVFSVWTSTSSSEELEEESHKEENNNLDLELTKESPRKKPKPGSYKNTKDYY
jgi:hypothetical protein